MLKKKMNALRSLMRDTFASEANDAQNMKNWMLPFNHFVSMTEHKQNFAQTMKACKRLQTPFDASLLYKEIGGHIFLQRSEIELFKFARKLK